ncbi:hypothetical protein L211DRAFT_496388 [Terfezia boudieri ATCC MYA-4762]|uniref:Uncharacterized protein n=1 Tax=Terfezia boudieri ATCC MYA-4762 TaxID=1051890 RepID=A0A3N4LHB2_9PEZI|nr:hypothetical protein L211DRAFT_496388 [Terfezia boudieri ATCC MYA-4762]
MYVDSAITIFHRFHIAFVMWLLMPLNFAPAFRFFFCPPSFLDIFPSILCFYTEYVTTTISHHISPPRVTLTIPLPYTNLLKYYNQVRFKLLIPFSLLFSHYFFLGLAKLIFLILYFVSTWYIYSIFTTGADLYNFS